MGSKDYVVNKILAVGLAMVLAGCDSDNASIVSDDQPKLTWEACEYNDHVQCATLEVPVDHDVPDGEKISIALNRIEATGSEPMGSLLFNPGGPGGSGIQLLKDIADEGLVPDSIRQAYHLVGFDPRGIGESTPVDCSEFEIDDLEGYLPDFAAVQAYQQQLSTVADACFRKYGSYLLR